MIQIANIENTFPYEETRNLKVEFETVETLTKWFLKEYVGHVEVDESVMIYNDIDLLRNNSIVNSVVRKGQIVLDTFTKFAVMKIWR